MTGFKKDNQFSGKPENDNSAQFIFAKTKRIL